MQSLTQPTLLLKPFAESGDKNSIPTTNTDTSNPQRADLTNGFPAVTSLSPDSGGLPPERKDFNGLGYLTTTYDYFYQAGGTFTYNATIASAIGGYPLGARLWYTDGNGATVILRSNKANNSDNFITTPSYIGTSWVQETPALSWNNTWTGSNTFSGNLSSSGSNTFSGANTFTGNITSSGANTWSGGNTFSGSITSSANNTWTGNNTFSNTITGNISGNAGTVTNGVYTNTNQTISGNKTFSGTVTLNGSLSAGTTAKNTITDWCSPNYERTTSYTKNSAVPNDGFVFLAIRTSSDEKTFSVTVNSHEVYSIWQRYREKQAIFVPVKKGDKVNWSGTTFDSAISLHFVPCVGG